MINNVVCIFYMCMTVFPPWGGIDGRNFLNMGLNKQLFDVFKGYEN